MLDKKCGNQQKYSSVKQFLVLSFVFMLNIWVKIQGKKVKFCHKNRKFKKW